MVKSLTHIYSQSTQIQLFTLETQISTQRRCYKYVQYELLYAAVTLKRKINQNGSQSLAIIFLQHYLFQPTHFLCMETENPFPTISAFKEELVIVTLRIRRRLAVHM
jgi:hypothetical protein